MRASRRNIEEDLMEELDATAEAAEEDAEEERALPGDLSRKDQQSRRRDLLGGPAGDRPQ